MYKRALPHEDEFQLELIQDNYNRLNLRTHLLSQNGIPI